MERIIDLQEKYYDDPKNLENKEKYLKSCFNTFINTPSSINELVAVAKREGVDTSVIIECARIYYSSFVSKKSVCHPYKLKLSAYKVLTAKSLIKKFIDSDTFIEEEFCKDSKCTIEEFNECLEIVKLFDNEKHLKYLLKVSDNNEKYREYVINKIKELVSDIRDGVEVSDGVYRDYDAIDFFKNNCLDLLTLKKYGTTANLGSENALALSMFLKYKIGVVTKGTKTFISLSKMDSLLKIKSEICCLSDSNGNLIENTGVVLDEEQKLYLIKYLEDNNIPLNKLTFSAVAKRYVGGVLFFKKNLVTGNKEEITITDLCKILRGRKTNEVKNYHLRNAYIKKCYNLFVLNDGNREKLDKISKEIGMNVYTIKKNALEYATTILKINEVDFFNKYSCFYMDKSKPKKNKMVPTLYNQLVLNLIRTDNEEEIIKIMSKYGEDYLKERQRKVDFKYLRSRINDTVNSFFGGDENLINDLKRKIDIYLNYKKNLDIEEKQKLEKEIKLYVIDILQDFINSNGLTIEEYCIKNNLVCKDLLNCVRKNISTEEAIVKIFINKVDMEKKSKDEKTLHQKEKMVRLFEQRIYSLLELMIYYLGNGIESNSVKREFDIIDYYKFIGIKKEYITRICRKFKFSNEDIKLVGSLFTKYSFFDNVSEKIAFLKEDNIYKRKDRVVSIEERRKIFEYLQKLGTPLNYGFFKIAMDKYIDGNLFDDNLEKIVKLDGKSLKKIIS